MIMNKIDLKDKVAAVKVAAYDLTSGRARY
jgi:hypothetical protein